MTPRRVILVGIAGYGRVHLEHLRAMQQAGEVVLVAAVVIDAAAEGEACAELRRIGCALLPDFESLLRAVPQLRVDLAIVPTPIHLHTGQTVALLRAGVHVLVEKPLAATTGDADRVAAAARAAGRVAAVGFQYLHAPEVRALKQRLLAGEIGALRRVAVHGAWPRSHGYYQRNGWAGHLRVDQAWVLDSPVANAMAHFFMLLLYLAGETPDGVAEVTRMSAELYRAQQIESFDTAVLAMETSRGCALEFYGTHSTRAVARPVLVIEGERGRAEWLQDSHALLVEGNFRWRREASPEPGTRECMLRDVLARLDDPQRFVCTPAMAREHVRCVNALHEHARIIEVPPAYLATRDEAGEVFTCVEGLDEQLRRAFATRSDLRAAGAAWAQPAASFDLRGYAGLAAAPGAGSAEPCA